jgi:hypothetical protein
MDRNTAIHNGERRQWNYLEVVDRASGEVERIPLDDRNSADSVAGAANRIGINVSAAWDILLNGCQLTTAGYVRQLAK